MSQYDTGQFYAEDVVPSSQIAVDGSAIKELLRTDPEFFIAFFLGEELTVPVPDFHIQIFRQMVDMKVQQMAIAVPRGHAKTTLAKLAAVYYFLFTTYRFILYVSNTERVAVDAVRDIIGFMQSPNFEATFGCIEFEIEQRGAGFYIFTLNGKRCILRALGAGSQVRGINVDNQRPELCIGDDLESYENTDGPTQIREMKRWFYGTLRKAMDIFRCKFIQIGNLISIDGVLATNLKSKFWHATRLGVIRSDNTPLWPDVWPMARIRMDYAEYVESGNVHHWFAEMMNTPIPAGKGLIDVDRITYRPGILPGHSPYGFITIDPAISKETWADRSAIVAHGWSLDDQAWMPGEYVLERGMDPLALIQTAIEMCVRWGFNFIAVEGVAYQQALEPFIKYHLAMRGLTHIHVFAVAKGKASKASRLAAWASQLRDKVYVLPQGDFEITEQLLMFDPVKKKNDDDLIDSCAQGPEIITNFMHLIGNNQNNMHVVNPNDGFIDGYTMCKV